MYNSDDIQKMIETCNNNDKLKDAVLNGILPFSDRQAVQDVLSEGWYERFDRYDSDVCEKFIVAYEKGV